MSDLTPALPWTGLRLRSCPNVRPDPGCGAALRLGQIVQLFLQCRLYRELAEQYLQATTLRRAAHGADNVTIRDGKRCQA